ncbi:MAG: glycosyltransferase family 4 protein [Alphaproteobacteria bacterium]|nr:glycosyltransferase family 4 protein [Alphaproteobacteria bacterium]OJV11923.1 MAG: hypothetical protein BGO27_00455 [Alphaproteobacteria bacterium 33-17]
MRILNIMFSKGLGGIEQVFIDYDTALKQCGLEVLSICHPKFPKAKDNFIKISNIGWWDLWASYKIRKVIKDFKPDCIIVHGSRAVRLTLRASKVPAIGVAHNYWIKHLLKCDYIFSITKHLQSFIEHKGFRSNKIYHMPNMINTDGFEYKNKLPKKPLKIAAMGRFVKKKGFEVLIQAAKILLDRKLDFTLVIGGDGEMKEEYTSLVNKLGLDSNIEFIGWVKDKDQLYNNTDIFVLPSHSEPFGIVVLEAFLYSTPIISTSSEGPQEIIENNKNGILVPLNNPQKMAEAILNLANNNELYQNLSKNGFSEVDKYSFENGGKRMKKALKDING